MSAIDPRPPAQKSTWVALALPPTAWAVFESGLALALRLSCQTVGIWLGPLWGAASLAACCGAMALAWPSAKAGRGGDSPAGAWLAWIALMVAPLFGLAIAFQTLATFIVPSCAR
ncbi:MAG: hypothetical protein JWO15_3362 [Sphingomonadales bacterium]|jgi:hypothetical protein|nr:hypothetical protein [Sphingomonadales bacterium]